MFRKDKAISSTAAGVGMIVLLIVGAVAGYYVRGTGGVATSTVTVTSTVASSGSSSSSQSGVASTCTSNSSLYADAKKEGVVSFFSTQTAEELQGMQAAFQNDCPGVTLEFTEILGAAAQAQLQTQFTTKTHTTDLVMDTGAGQLTTYESLGWLVKYSPPNAANVPDALKDPNGSWVGVRVPYFVVAYNTKLVNSSSLPTSMMDMIQPQWSGKIAIGDPYAYIATLEYWGGLQKALGSNFTAFANGMHAQHPLLTKTNDLAAADIANGQAQVGLTLTSSMYPLIQKGEPIAALPIGPIVGLPVGIAMLQGAPHPNAARLFEDWILSNNAMKFFQSFGDPTATGLFPSQYSALVPLAGKYSISYLSNVQAQAFEQQLGLPWTS